VKLHGDLVFIQDQKTGQEVIAHYKIYHHFGKENIANISKNQTLLYGEFKKDGEHKLKNENDVVNLLKRSKNYSHIEDIKKLAEGGEAVVYSINYVGYDEVVLKIPKVKY
jgi:hypothetical protein